MVDFIFENDEYPAFDYLDEDMIFEMANLRQDDTGLPMIIWIDGGGSDRKRSPRVKISKSHSHRQNIHDTVSVSIEDEPRIVSGDGLGGEDFLLVSRYVTLNKDALLRYWKGDISTLELHRYLKKI